MSLARRRAAAQLLDGAGGRTAEAVAGHLLAVQAQDARAWPLALRARGAEPPAGGEPAASAPTAGGLVITWLLRGTLHLVAAGDLPWLYALTGRLTERTSLRRLGGLGVDPAATSVLLRALDDGPRTRAELAAALEAAGVRAEGQRTPHLIALAAAQGELLPGLDGRLHRAAPPAGVDRDAALAELARRYLRGHGPACDRDLAAWSGLPLRDARAGLAAIAGRAGRGAGRPRRPRRPPAAAGPPAPGAPPPGLRPVPARLARPQLRRPAGPRPHRPPGRRDHPRDDRRRRRGHGHLAPRPRPDPPRAVPRGTGGLTPRYRRRGQGA